MKTVQGILIKTANEVDILRKAGKILGSIVVQLQGSLTSGMSTKDIDLKAQELIHRHHVASAFKGYRGFPGCTCISVNEGVVHGIPGKRTIKDGDIVSLDLGIIHEGYYSDTAVTVPVGNIAPALQRLIDVTKGSLSRGIEQARPGNRLSDISFAVQSFVEMHGFSVVRDFVGHGIGHDLHEEPEIPNYGRPGQGPVLCEGMVFAIEPMVNMGTHRTRILNDGWTVVTEDGQPSAHFEHTIVIGSNGPEILTQ
ncbi:MAG: type I methionyl aminopeptidase [Candidatus Omnitrophica bacterium]|nr:type I methionyl aminopeptidase [Candidatus Omnitrophota bacterium]MDE2008502.1 type I methionyl aminopeptidase [Candidatus Omnitrophota bacterium]MDE2213968.1 type I methionyl aminopeptidase [Candidatus Omnitrophota bacterium]MDE2231377.1 type I methionyl aminopeptidase [Candidatus Omnitrophota bacterium]